MQQPTCYSSSSSGHADIESHLQRWQCPSECSLLLVHLKSCWLATFFFFFFAFEEIWLNIFFFAARCVRCPDRRVDDLLAFLFSLKPILWTTSDILSDRVCSGAQDSCLWDHFSLFCVELPKTIVCMIVNMACLIFCWFRHSKMTGRDNPI